MNILSLFDGMACGMLAMQSAGIKVDRYVAFEIDKYAVQTSSHNFPTIEQRGDVFLADFTEFRGFDFLIGGSPCTKWSIARTKGRETEASGIGWELFCQYVRALHEAKPRYFIYENNKSMHNNIRAAITEAFGFEPICINSALVSAQNRQRLYWVGRRNADGTYSRVNVDQPEDMGILLRDVLDTGFSINTTADGEKARTLMAGYYKYGIATLITNEGFTGGTTAVAIPVNTTTEGKAQCLRATYYKDGIRNLVGNNVDQKTCIAEPLAPHTACESETVLKAIPDIVNKYGYLPDMFNAYNRSEITDKAPTLSTGSMVTSSCAVNRLESIYYAIPCEWSEDGKPTKAISGTDGKVYPVYEVKDGQITIKGKRYPIKLEDGFYIIRKLTVCECKRLQTVPEWYVFPVSDSQAYKLLGNGWTVEVIVHLVRATKILN